MDRAITLRAAIVAALALAVFAVAQRAPSPAHAQSMPCQAPYRGFDFDTYEARDYITTYGQAIQLAAAGHGFIAPYTLAGTGEPLDFSFPGLESGSGVARTAPSASLSIPPTIFESIVWAESGWGNGDRTVPYGGVGPGLLSGDCGYGLGQVTTGMGQFGSDAYAPGVPSARQALIGTDYLANLAEAARILAGKWNSAPEYRPIAGNGDPAKLENWYYAIWSYNGFALQNHPLNPDLDPLRGGGSSVEAVFHCYDKQAPNYDALSTGQPAFSRSDFTYPEIIYGCMRYPPYIPGQSPQSQTAGTTFAVGDAVVVAQGTCTNMRSQPSTSASVVTCLAGGTALTVVGGPQSGSGYTWWQVSTASGTKGWVAADFLVKSSTGVPSGPPTPNPPPLVSATGRMWLPQQFSMPDFSVPAIAAAFQLSNFATCQDNGWSGGCSSMDYPTEVPTAKPPITTHTDTTPRIATSLLNTLIGSPSLAVSGPTSMALGISSTGAVSSGSVTVSNAGTSVAPFRIRTSAAWIVVNHPGDSPDRTMDGGVAVGSDIAVVTRPPQGSNPAVTQPGYQSVLQVTLNPETTPPGSSTGTVTIEPLLGSGAPVTITISARNAGSTEKLTHQLRAPQISSDGVN
jgi:hypothetical protein